MRRINITDHRSQINHNRVACTLSFVWFDADRVCGGTELVVNHDGSCVYNGLFHTWTAVPTQWAGVFLVRLSCLVQSSYAVVAQGLAAARKGDVVTGRYVAEADGAVAVAIGHGSYSRKALLARGGLDCVAQLDCEPRVRYDSTTPSNSNNRNRSFVRPCDETDGRADGRTDMQRS